MVGGAWGRGDKLGYLGEIIYFLFVQKCFECQVILPKFISSLQ